MFWKEPGFDGEEVSLNDVMGPATQGVTQWTAEDGA